MWKHLIFKTNRNNLYGNQGIIFNAVNKMDCVFISNLRSFFVNICTD